MYPEMDREEREILMAKQCLRTENADYSKPLTDDEVIAEQNGYSRQAISLASLEAQKKQAIAQFASQIKALKSIMEEQLKVIQNGKREVNGKLYLFPDQQGGVMRYYDVWGNIVNSRPLVPTERQTTLFIGENGENKHVAANGHETEDAGFTIEEQTIETGPGTAAAHGNEAKTEAPTDPEKPKKRAASRKKTDKPADGEDINAKVKSMIDNRKASKSKPGKEPLIDNDNLPE